MQQMLKELAPRHQQIARLLVGGSSQSEIARLLKVHKSTVSRLVRDPIVVQEIRRLQEIADSNVGSCVPGISQEIQDGARKGIVVLKEILEDERDDPEILKLKANISLEFLARAGYAPVKQVMVQQASVSAHVTAEEIEEIKERGRKALQSFTFNIDQSNKE